MGNIEVLLLREMVRMILKNEIDTNDPTSGQVDYILEADPPSPTHYCNLGKVRNTHIYIFLAF